MPYIITTPELEQLSDAELHRKFNAILHDLAHRNLTVADCPLASVTLGNIRRVLQRRMAHKPRPHF